MGSQTHISFWILIGNLLVLPVLFGIHATEHEHELSDDLTQYEIIIQETECSFCDLFLDQTSIIGSVTSYQSFAEVLSTQNEDYQAIGNIIRNPNLLRGPPANNLI